MPRQPADKRLDPPIPALHPERDALLAAVRDADPQDDLPALVYADWQDEHDQPEHAELIRVMCEMGHSRTRDKKARRSVLLARMKDLFKTPPLKPLRELETDTWGFDRGFVRELTLEVLPDLPAGPVRDRGGCGPPGQLDLPSFVPFDKVAWLGLMLPINPTAELVAALASQPWFRRVDRLESHWRGGRIGPDVLRPLTESPHAAGLQTFHANTATVPADDLVRLYLAPTTTGLRVLDLDNLYGRMIAAGARRPSQAALAEAVERIVSSPRAEQLVSLGERTAPMDEALARVFLAARHLGGVRSFSYDACRLRPRTAARMAERFRPRRGG